MPVLNQRGFMAYAEYDIQRVEQYIISDLSILMLDIDHFKVTNDTYGHAAGDDILASLAEYLQARQRASDRLARLGGEEFVVLHPDAPYQKALLVAEQMLLGNSVSTTLPVSWNVPAGGFAGTILHSSHARR
jgi:diguanylate cyclase (GGDEF)-like protein